MARIAGASTQAGLLAEASHPLETPFIVAAGATGDAVHLALVRGEPQCAQVARGWRVCEAERRRGHELSADSRAAAARAAAAVRGWGESARAASSRLDEGSPPWTGDAASADPWEREEERGHAGASG